VVVDVRELKNGPRIYRNRESNFLYLHSEFNLNKQYINWTNMGQNLSLSASNERAPWLSVNNEPI